MGSRTCCFHSGFSISFRTTQETVLMRSDILSTDVWVLYCVTIKRRNPFENNRRLCAIRG
jgi:hypothetical protein